MKITQVKTLPIDAESRQKTAHCYFFAKGESMVQNLQLRHNRPHAQYKIMLDKVMAKTEFHELWQRGHIKAAWSQYTGCQCGCSPGFRLTGLQGSNIFVDVQY